MAFMADDDDRVTQALIELGEALVEWVRTIRAAVMPATPVEHAEAIVAAEADRIGAEGCACLCRAWGHDVCTWRAQTTVDLPGQGVSIHTCLACAGAIVAALSV